MGAHPTVLLFCDYYLPGVKGGGAIRAVANLVERLGDEIEFMVVTGDRDIGDRKPYPGVETNGWARIGKANVWHLPTGLPSIRTLASIMKNTPCDVLYFNSLFSRRFTLAPLCLWQSGLSTARKLVLAPRGELAEGALSVKRYRKLCFLSGARALRLFRSVTWLAASPHEKADIERWFNRATVIVAPDVPAPMEGTPKRGGPASKTAGKLKLVCVTRITPVKNLVQALVMLSPLRGQIVFDVYGPVEDSRYWKQCERIIEALPSSIEVRYRGVTDHETIPQLLSNYHVFYLPTLGESFSYAILEALAGGCPVLISDRTPWRNLEAAGVGWDVPLEDADRFTRILQQCVDMSAEELLLLSESAVAYAITQCETSDAIRRNRAVLSRRKCSMSDHPGE